MSENVERARIERELAFHNDRFTEEVRTGQDKYYFALERCDARSQSLICEAARGSDVLEYGCAKGEESVPLARIARSLTGIDLSDVAIAQAEAAGRAAGLANVTFKAMNGEALEFADASFDLVFGTGILHHLDLDRAYSEIARVLRPGGKAIFKEPLGHNAVFNLYRKLTPDVRTADEHPLLSRDINLARRFFSKVDCDYFGLTTLATVPFRNTRIGKPLRALCAAVDDLVTRAPGLRLQAWYTLMAMEK
jgi:SAM-dependent methyltransferase